jgi:hypothetical protein
VRWQHEGNLGCLLSLLLQQLQTRLRFLVPATRGQRLLLHLQLRQQPWLLLLQRWQQQH